MATDRDEILRLLDASIRLLDDERYDQWLELFAPDATYLIVCKDGVTELGSHMVDTDRQGIAARIELLKDPSRVRVNTAVSHLVSWGPIDFVDKDTALIASRFALFETRNTDGVTKLGYVGHYEDRLMRVNGTWRFASRKAVLDTMNFRALLAPI
ncbi:MAG: nuclear transport factor 2 family protein [Candidatus Binataceae bacterium]|nr:nuclear transport factor 2 family protein [Candidatus Binataceae bacterium]